MIAVLQAAYATLTYALLGYGIAIGIFGISFFLIKRWKKGKTIPINAQSENTEKSTGDDRPMQNTVKIETE